MNEPPSITKPSLLLILSAPSGAGKTTLAHRLQAEFPKAVFSVSYTTRSPRGTERDGIDYYFIDAQTFQRKAAQGEFVEWAQVHNNFYGSAQSVIDDAIRSGELAIFDIDVQGGQTIKRKYPEAISIFVMPPSLAELERRLHARGTDSEQTIQQRLDAARAEIDRGVATYDYIIVNDSLEKAFAELKSVVVAERCRRRTNDIQQSTNW